MPQVLRAMKTDAQDGQPVVGDRFAELGVRPGKDIVADGHGAVGPGNGGMSVQSCVSEMNVEFIPKRYAHLIEGACGDNRFELYFMGSGPFVSGALANELGLRIDSRDSSHGFVEPERVVLLEQFQQDLAATRDQWAVVDVAGERR